MLKKGEKYVNNKSKQVVLIDKVNEKSGTVIALFLNTDGTVRMKFNKDGEKIPENRTFTSATIERNYTLFGSSENEEKKPETKNSTTAKPKAPKADSSKQESKPKAEKKAKTPKKSSGISEEERTAIRDDLVASVQKLGITAFVPDKYPMWISVAFSENGKVVFGAALNSNHIRMRAKSDLLPKDTEFKQVKGGFDATINLEYANRKQFVDIIAYAVKNFSDSDLVSRKRRSKTSKETTK